MASLGSFVQGLSQGLMSGPSAADREELALRKAMFEQARQQQEYEQARRAADDMQKEGTRRFLTGLMFPNGFGDEFTPRPGVDTSRINDVPMDPKPAMGLMGASPNLSLDALTSMYNQKEAERLLRLKSELENRPKLGGELETLKALYPSATPDELMEKLSGMKDSNSSIKVIPPQAVVFDEKTRKPIFTNTNKTEKQGGSEWAPDVKPYYNPATNKAISVNVRDPNAIEMAKQLGFEQMTEQQKGYLSKIGEIGAKAEEEYSSEITKARGTINTLTSMDMLLDRFESGKLSGWEKTIQQYGDALGVAVDTKNLSSKEAFTALAEQLALQSRNLGPGQVLAGQMSDKDVQFLRDMNPQLLISKGGNKLIIKMRTAIAKRNQEIAKLIPEFKEQNNGVFDRSKFEEYVDSKIQKKSIFGIPEGAEFIGMDKKTGLPAYATPESKARGAAFVPSF